MSRSRPEISIVVPTHNRLACLERCLVRLAAQETTGPFEIIVVDDGSDSPERVAELVASTPGARLVRQTGLGPAAARNAGVEAALGSVVCFTDDDCEPDPTWAQTLADAIRRGADVAAGSTRDAEARNWLARALHVQVEHFASESGIPFAASNNIASASRVLREVPFDSRYTRAAAEDRDWCERLASSGYRIEHEPGACLYHNQELTLAGYLRKQVRYGRGSWRYHRWTSQRPFERPLFYSTLLRKGFREHAAIGLLVMLGQAALVLGYVQEWGSSKAVNGGTVVRRGVRSRRRTSRRP